MAQTIGEAFYIYRNDGQFNAFFRDEVISIEYSYEDADGNTYDEIVTQVVNTTDSVYMIPLAAIEKIEFVTPETIYRPGVVQIVGELRDYVISSKDMTISFSSNIPQNLLPKVGDKLVTVEMSEVFPIGFAGEVKNVTLSDCYVVECDTTELENIFERYFSNISIEMQSESTNSVMAKRAYSSNRSNSFDGNIPLPSFSKTFDISGSLDVSEDMPFSLGASIGISIIPTCHANCSFIVDPSIGTYFNARIVTDVTSTEDISFSGKIGLSHDFPFGIFNYPVLPLVNFYIEPGLFVDFQAQLCWSSSFTQRYRHYYFVTFDSRYPENNQRKGFIKHLGTEHLDDILTGGGYAEVGGYFETGFSVVCKDFSRVGVRAELGVKVELDATANLSDFENSLSSTSLYDMLNTDRCLSLNLFGGLKFVGSFWKFSESAGLELTIGDNLFEGGLVPRFYDLNATRINDNPSVVDATASISRKCLLPVETGFQLYDEDDKPIGSPQYFNTMYQNENFQSYELSLDGLSSYKKYQVRPCVKLFGYDVLASPSVEVDKLEIEAITLQAENVGVTSATLVGLLSPFESDMTGSVAFYIGTSPTPTVSGARISAGSVGSLNSGEFRKTIADFEPNTTYYYTAAYISDEGEVSYGETESFTTAKPEVEVSTEEPISVQSDYAVVSAQTSLNSIEGYEYGFYYNFTGPNDKMTHLNKSSDFSNGRYTSNIYFMGNDVVYYQAYLYKDSRYYYGEVQAAERKEDEHSICPDSNHPHWIDLGIGTLWRCCNEGASTPEGYGGYYTFNEAQAYNAPSYEQIKALLNNCSYTWTTQNGVAGGKFTGPNGGTIFLPAAGSPWGGAFYGAGVWGYYWSSTPYGPGSAYVLYFNSDGARWDYYGGRYYVRSVR